VLSQRLNTEALATDEVASPLPFPPAYWAKTAERGDKRNINTRVKLITFFIAVYSFDMKTKAVYIQLKMI
jgi:hypothetical protein